MTNNPDNMDSGELRAEVKRSQRINLPLDLAVWKSRPESEVQELTWFHQHVLDQGMSWDEAAEAIGYDRSTVFRLLKGTYAAEDWSKPLAKITSYRRLAHQRASIQQQEFAPNALTRLVSAGLDYALANNSITTIIGESRSGKSAGSIDWAARHNHGQTVYVVAPPVGSALALMRTIAAKVGVYRKQGTTALYEALKRAFNSNRILIVDEAHRLMPSGDARSVPIALELLRDLHDQTGCALALIATARFSDRLKSGAYQYEQLIGRIGMPIRLPAKIRGDDVRPIVAQYVKSPGKDLMAEMTNIANRPGRMGILVETLKVASRVAAKAGETLTEDHVRRAISIRNQMSGGGL